MYLTFLLVFLQEYLTENIHYFFEVDRWLCFWGIPKRGYSQELSLSLNSPLSLCLRKFMSPNTKFEIISGETKTEFMWLSLRMSLRIFVHTVPGQNDFSTHYMVFSQQGRNGVM